LVAESPCGLPVPVSFSERLKMLIDFALRKSAMNARCNHVLEKPEYSIKSILVG
jgi:hypothetical protein